MKGEVKTERPLVFVISFSKTRQFQLNTNVEIFLESIKNQTKVFYCYRKVMKVLTFNCWAIGYVPFMTKDRKQRVTAIARYLTAKKEYYDLVCLQELWTSSDRNLIKEACEKVLPYSVSFYG